MGERGTLLWGTLGNLVSNAHIELFFLDHVTHTVGLLRHWHHMAGGAQQVADHFRGVLCCPLAGLEGLGGFRNPENPIPLK